MAGMIRPNKAAMKIAYSILKTPKNKQQKNSPEATEKQKYEWFRDSMLAQ